MLRRWYIGVEHIKIQAISKIITNFYEAVHEWTAFSYKNFNKYYDIWEVAHIMGKYYLMRYVEGMME